MVRTAIQRALDAGLKLDTAIIAYVHLAFVVAPNFDEHEIVQRIISSLHPLPDELPFLLGERLSTDEWAQIRQASDSRSWGLGTSE